MRVLSLLAATLFGLAGLPAFAQAPPDGTPTAVRGTVEKLDGQSLTVKPKEGPPVTITLAANFTVAGVAKRSLADVKPGDYVATNSIKGSDGQLHAIEMHIFPEAMKATVQEGQRPSSLVQGGLMTNAFVVEVTASPQGQLLKGK